MLLHLIKNVEPSSKYQPYSLRARAFAPAELAILREQPVGALVLPVRPAGRRREEQGDLFRVGRSLAYGFGTAGVGYGFGYFNVVGDWSLAPRAKRLADAAADRELLIDRGGLSARRAVRRETLFTPVGPSWRRRLAQLDRPPALRDAVLHVGAKGGLLLRDAALHVAREVEELVDVREDQPAVARQRLRPGTARAVSTECFGGGGGGGGGGVGGRVRESALIKSFVTLSMSLSLHRLEMRRTWCG